MVYTATPDGKGTANPRRLIGVAENGIPKCPKGHVLYGVGRHSSGLFTCQHRVRSGDNGHTASCSHHMYVASILGIPVVIELDKEEFDVANRSGAASAALIEDLQMLVAAALLVNR